MGGVRRLIFLMCKYINLQYKQTHASNHGSGFQLNIVKRSAKILKAIGQQPPWLVEIPANFENFIRVDARKCIYGDSLHYANTADEIKLNSLTWIVENLILVYNNFCKNTRL